MSEQIFNTVFERSCRAGTARAGTAHVQRHDAVLIAMKNNIAAILCHRGAHPRIEQLLYRADNFCIRPGFVILGAAILGIRALVARMTGRPATK